MRVSQTHANPPSVVTDARRFFVALTDCATAWRAVLDDERIPMAQADRAIAMIVRGAELLIDALPSEN